MGLACPFKQEKASLEKLEDEFLSSLLILYIKQNMQLFVCLFEEIKAD